jgi:hypothetical protein
MFDPNQALPDFQTQQQELERKRAMAEMLRRQSSSPMPQGQMVGNQFVAPSFAQYLPGLLNAAQSAYAQKQAGDAEKAYGQQVAQAKQQWQSSLPQATAAIPGREELFGPQEMGGSPELAAVPEVPAQRPDTPSILKATIAGLNIPGNEKVAQLYSQGMLTEKAREDQQTFNKEQAAARLAAERQNTLDRLANQKAIADQNAANAAASIEQRAEAAKESARLQGLILEGQQQMRVLTKTLGAARRSGSGGGGGDDIIDEVGKGVVEIIDPATGAKRTVSRAEAVRLGAMSAKEGNIDAKTEKAAEKTESARKGIITLVDQMQTYYDELDRLGGMPNEDRSSFSNALSRAASSGPGQFGGSVIGSREQTLRDNVADSRLRLLNAIKNAEGTGVGSLNSNMELKTYLDALTSPTRNKQNVDTTLKNIRGLIAKADAPTVVSGSPAAPGAAPSAAPPAAATRTIGGKTYVNRNGQWFEQ